MSDQNTYIITKEDLEVIMNAVKRLPWIEANIVMARIMALKRFNVKEETEETEEDLPFINKFSGTGDRNEETKEERALLSGDVIWGGDGTPTTY
jgi:hypothetical protein